MFTEVFKRKCPIKYNQELENKCVLFFYKIITDEILKNDNNKNMVSLALNSF